MVQFGKFRILNTKDEHRLDTREETLLINYDHIISIKPIRIVSQDEIIDGYWIRTSNGKKYRAVEIPQDLKKGLGRFAQAPDFDSPETEHLSQSHFIRH